MADDAPLQFEALGSNVAARRRDKHRSDPFEGAAHVVRVRIVNQRIATAPIEGNAVLVRPDRRTDRPPGSRPSIPTWPATCWPRSSSSPKDQVRVVAPHVGGAFGGKAGMGPTTAPWPWPARRCGRPVKWTETRPRRCSRCRAEVRCSTPRWG